MDDPDSNILLYILLASLLILSAFFSSVKTAFEELSEIDQQYFKKKTNKKSDRIRHLLNHIEPLDLTLNITITVINLTVVCVGTITASLLAQQFNARVEIILLLMIFLLSISQIVFNELWLKHFVISKSELVAGIGSFPVSLYYKFVGPLIRKVNSFFKFLQTKLSNSTSNVELNHEQLKKLVTKNGQFTDLEKNEQEMIHAIFELGKTQVHEIMIPRTDIVSVDVGTSLEDLIKLVKVKGHSRFPLYTEDVDNIVGIIHVKDLLSYFINNKPKAKKPNLKNLTRPTHFVPETKNLHDLLQEFQKEKHHMAIVVDEYGGTTGLVTLEDVIEEIVGDIQDEYDQEPPLYLKIAENIYSIDAKIDLHELNDSLQLDLPTEGEYDSLGGFILNLTGYVPVEKEVVEYNNYSFTIEKINRNRIIRVKLCRQLDNKQVEIQSANSSVKKT